MKKLLNRKTKRWKEAERGKISIQLLAMPVPVQLFCNTVATVALAEKEKDS